MISGKKFVHGGPRFGGSSFHRVASGVGVAYRFAKLIHRETSQLDVSILRPQRPAGLGSGRVWVRVNQALLIKSDSVNKKQDSWQKK